MGSIANYIYETAARHGKRAQCFGGAKNHMLILPDADMDQVVDALVGAGYGSAGERCMAISVAVPVGQATADALVKKLVPRVESLKVGLSSDASADYGPLVTREAMQRVRGYIDQGVQEGAKLLVDGRDVGVVTLGMVSKLTGRTLGIARLDTELAVPGAPLTRATIHRDGYRRRDPRQGPNVTVTQHKATRD